VLSTRPLVELTRRAEENTRRGTDVFCSVGIVGALLTYCVPFLSTAETGIAFFAGEFVMISVVPVYGRIVHALAHELLGSPPDLCSYNGTEKPFPHGQQDAIESPVVVSCSVNQEGHKNGD
jgi:hypothetical protein